MKKILVLCTGNSCRSQMAEGYLRLFAAGRAEVYSAGIEAHGLNPRAVQVMDEAGIDISGHKSKTLSELGELNFDFVITVCDNAREHCPVFTGTARKFHHDFPDPATSAGTETEIMNAFRSVRNELKEYSRNFIEEAFR